MAVAAPLTLSNRDHVHAIARRVGRRRRRARRRCRTSARRARRARSRRADCTPASHVASTLSRRLMSVVGDVVRRARVRVARLLDDRADRLVVELRDDPRRPERVVRAACWRTPGWDTRASTSRDRTRRPRSGRRRPARADSRCASTAACRGRASRASASPASARRCTRCRRDGAARTSCRCPGSSRSRTCSA